MKTKKRVLGPVLLALSAAPAAADTPVTCTFDAPIAVRIATYATRAALKARYRALVPPATRLELMRRKPVLEGFATLRAGVHTLHVLDSDWERNESRLAVLGHELLHAFCRRWHPRAILAPFAAATAVGKGEFW